MPTIPPLPDTERRTTYTIVSPSTDPVDVGFDIYGSGSDPTAWIEVWVNGVPLQGWTLSSVTGPLATIPRPITDAKITPTAAWSGTIQIVGARRPSRTSQFSEGVGVPASSQNRIANDIVATQREAFDNRDRSLVVPPGETLSRLPPAASRVNSYLGFDSNGQPQVVQDSPSGGLLSNLRWVPTVSDFDTLPTINDGEVILTTGVTAPGDGLPSTFQYDAASTDTVDNANVFPAPSLVGRIKRIDGSIDIRKWGAKLDGSDDGNAFRSAAASGESIFVPGRGAVLAFGGEIALANDGQAISGEGGMFPLTKGSSLLKPLDVNDPAISWFRGSGVVASTGIPDQIDGVVWQNFVLDPGVQSLATMLTAQNIDQWRFVNLELRNAYNYHIWKRATQAKFINVSHQTPSPALINGTDQPIGYGLWLQDPINFRLMPSNVTSAQVFVTGNKITVGSIVGGKTLAQLGVVAGYKFQIKNMNPGRTGINPNTTWTVKSVSGNDIGVKETLTADVAINTTTFYIESTWGNNSAIRMTSTRFNGINEQDSVQWAKYGVMIENCDTFIMDGTCGIGHAAINFAIAPNNSSLVTEIQTLPGFYSDHCWDHCVDISGYAQTYERIRLQGLWRESELDYAIKIVPTGEIDGINLDGAVIGTPNYGALLCDTPLVKNLQASNMLIDRPAAAGLQLNSANFSVLKVGAPGAILVGNTFRGGNSTVLDHAIHLTATAASIKEAFNAVSELTLVSGSPAIFSESSTPETNELSIWQTGPLPTIGAATTGDLVVSPYTQQWMRMRLRDGTFEAEMLIEFTPTFTTASGNLRIGGLPVQRTNPFSGSPPPNSEWLAVGSAVIIGVSGAGPTFPSGATQIQPVFQSSVAYMNLQAMGSAIATGNNIVQIGALTSGSSYRLYLRIRYEV